MKTTLAGMALPLRLLGGLHRLALDGRAPALRRWYPSIGGQWDAEAAWPDIVRAAAEHADYLRGDPRPTAADQRGRPLGRADRWPAGVIQPIRLPVRLFEIGCSAGLNLRADHYRYRYPGGGWGPVDSPVTIDEAWQACCPRQPG